jgi:hypothetical protein
VAVHGRPMELSWWSHGAIGTDLVKEESCSSSSYPARRGCDPSLLNSALASCVHVCVLVNRANLRRGKYIDSDG